VDTHIAAANISPIMLPAPFDMQPGMLNYDLQLKLVSPFRLKRHGRIAGPRELTLAFVASGAMERLNQLAAVVQEAEPLPPAPLVAEAALAFDCGRELAWQRWNRLTRSQDGVPIVLDGCMGEMRYECVSFLLAALLNWASLANVGRHASAGNGAITLNLSKSSN